MNTLNAIFTVGVIWLVFKTGQALHEDNQELRDEIRRVRAMLRLRGIPDATDSNAEESE